MRKISAIFISILLAINNTLPVLALEKDTVDSSTIPWTSSDNVNSSTISWTSSDNINQGDRFDPLEGVQALDKDGKNMTESLKIEGKVDTSIVGQHKLEYYFNDSENNKIEKTRIINVIESKKQANNTDNKIDTDEKEVSNLDISTYPNTIVVKGIVVGQGVGDIKAKIIFDKDEGKIKVTESSGYMLHDYYKGKKYFGIKIISNDGNIRLNETFNGDNSGDDIRDTLDGFEFKYGDFIELFHDEVDRLNITGDIIENDEHVGSKYFVYEITNNGLKDVKAVPVLKSITDISILKGTPITDDVMIKDIIVTDRNGDITQMKVEYNQKPNSDSLGYYTVHYTITNSYGYSIKASRKIFIKAQPEINQKPDASLTLELGSIENNESAIKDYLKSLVNVTDEDQVDIANSLVISNLADSLVISDILNPDSEGSYNIKYSVTDKDGYKAEFELTINVIRTINVTVPTEIPFQVVTNLKDKNADPFISGVMKIKNNNTSNVDVFVESFTKQTDSGDLEIVDPRTYSDWNQLPTDESMKKMALGMYAVSGLTSNSQLDKSNPLWLEESKINNINIGTIPRATTIGNPSECKLSFTSKHGKNFIGGRSKGKFNLVFRFE